MLVVYYTAHVKAHGEYWRFEGFWERPISSEEWKVLINNVVESLHRKLMTLCMVDGLESLKMDCISFQVVNYLQSAFSRLNEEIPANSPERWSATPELINVYGIPEGA